MDGALTAHEAACARQEVSTPGPSTEDTEPPAWGLGRGRVSGNLLAALARCALGLELECRPLAERLLHALRAERWRARAEAALASPLKPTGANPSLL